MTVNTQRLIGSLRRAELVAGDRASMVKLAVSNQTLIVTASSDISGNAYEELEVEQTGEDLTIAFNARYLVEILNHVKSAQDRDRISRAALAGRDPPARAARRRGSSSTCSCRCANDGAYSTRLALSNFRNYAQLDLNPRRD